mgnify:CR=1 FL=1
METGFRRSYFLKRLNECLALLQVFQVDFVVLYRDAHLTPEPVDFIAVSTAATMLTAGAAGDTAKPIAKTDEA